MADVTVRTETWIADFEASSERGPQWLRDLRRRGIERFSALGFPTTRLEEWKYTNPAPIARGGFRSGASAGVADDVVTGALTRGVDGPIIVLIDGRFSREHSRLGGLPEGVRVSSLAAALAEQPELVREHLGTLAGTDSALIALNTAFVDDGVLVRVAANRALSAPLQVVVVSTGGEQLASHPRLLVVLEQSAQATVIESFVTAGEGAHFTNVVSELVVGENATLEVVRLLSEGALGLHTATTAVRLDRSATLRLSAFSLGGALVRDETNVVLAGEGADCGLGGLYVVGGERHVDMRTFVDHAVPHGTSQQIYKGVLGGAGRGVFSGGVYVREGAQKTDARQRNQNLLLSSKAWVDTKPQLEILADDVKCAHGATVGQLDQDAIFYMRCRGVGADSARRMLTTAFAGEVIDRVSVEPVRDLLRAALSERMPEGRSAEEME